MRLNHGQTVLVGYRTVVKHTLPEKILVRLGIIRGRTRLADVLVPLRELVMDMIELRHCSGQ
jgi:hypothetical protein